MSDREAIEILGRDDLLPIETEEGIIGGYRKEKKISIVIPTFKRKEILLQNLEHMRPIWKDVEIVVVDDCSPDNTDSAIVQFMFENDINLRLLKNMTNLGTVKSMNIGIKNTSNDFIWLLADDNFIENPKQAIGIIKKSDEKFMATHLKMEKNRSLFSEIKGVLYKIPAKTLAGEVYNYNGNKKRTVLWCNNAFIFDRRIGLLFNEDDYKYNFFRSESEFEKKVRDKGIKINYHPEIVIVDKVAQSGGLRVHDKRKFLLFCIYNHIIFLKRNYRFSKYYKIPFYLILKTATHSQFAGSIMSTFKEAYYS
jgi:glycosyltransferase involved in cell wall biosynthesis